MGFTQPKRTATFTFAGTDYEGAEIHVTLDTDIGTFLDLDNMEGSDSFLHLMAIFAERWLVSWNLEDDAGQPIPSDAEGMKKLQPGLFGLLLGAWRDAVAGIPAPLARPSSNGVASPVGLIPTEASSLNLGDFSTPN